MIQTKRFFAILLLFCTTILTFAQQNSTDSVATTEELFSATQGEQIGSFDIKLTENDTQNAEIDSILVTKHAVISRFVDTLQTVSIKEFQRELPQKIDSSQIFSRGGHYLTASASVGYGGLDYKFNLGMQHGTVVGMVEFGYNYFFNDNWGIGVGLDFANYFGYAHATKPLIWPANVATDSDGEPYQHTSQPNAWAEKNRSFMLALPITAQFKHYFPQHDFSIYADLGVRLGYLFGGDYRVTQGSVDHTGFYEKWNLTLDNVHADFYNQPANNEHGNVPLGFSVGLTGGVGLLVPLTQKLDLVTGIFFNCGLNNSRPAERAKLGFYNPENEFYHHSFMPEYGGFVNSDQAGDVRLFAVGAKVGIRWHVAKTKPQSVEYEAFTQSDTLVTLHERFDTIYSESRDTIFHPVAKIRQIQARSIIWFDLDDYTPKIDPIDMLDEISEILVENPELKIEVNGHTCGLGGKKYNQRLSEKRAAAVAKLLESKGVKPEQMIIQGFGLSTPYFSESHQLYLDRRVEIVPINAIEVKE